MRTSQERVTPDAGRRAFSLVELMIVLSIIAIVAAIILPRFSGATTAASGSALKQDLVHLRQQIKLYAVHHDGVSPGYPGGNSGAAPTEDAFIDQMTQGTDRDGSVGPSSDPAFPFGPYITEVPVNPINGSSAIFMVANGAAFPGQPGAETGFGWAYKAETKEFRAYVPGTDERGVPYFDY